MQEQQLKSEFTDVVDTYKHRIQRFRTGRANPGLVEDLLVEYYGVGTPLKQLASISAPEPRMLVIAPWDKNAISDIEKAVHQAEYLGLNPVVDGEKLRLTMPEMTEERRKELTKSLNETTEEFKAELRRMRDDWRTSIKKAEQNSEISEDEKYRDLETLDKITKEFTEKLETLEQDKHDEIMTV
jgi:ribosome recycling factor